MIWVSMCYVPCNLFAATIKIIQFHAISTEPSYKTCMIWQVTKLSASHKTLVFFVSLKRLLDIIQSLYDVSSSPPFHVISNFWHEISCRMAAWTSRFTDRWYHCHSPLTILIEMNYWLIAAMPCCYHCCHGCPWCHHSCFIFPTLSLSSLHMLSTLSHHATIMQSSLRGWQSYLAPHSWYWQLHINHCRCWILCCLLSCHLCHLWPGLTKHVGNNQVVNTSTDSSPFSLKIMVTSTRCAPPSFFQMTRPTWLLLNWQGCQGSDILRPWPYVFSWFFSDVKKIT